MKMSTSVEVYKLSEDEYRLFKEKLDYLSLFLASGRHMAYQYKVLKIWVKHSFEYLPHDTSHRPESLRDCLNFHILLSFSFLTLIVEGFC